MRTSRPQTDPITPHAERLVSYMNTRPETILGYAKYFGNSNDAVSARMTDIDSNGFVVIAKNADGVESEVHVVFKERLNDYQQVRPVLVEMAREAETALNLPSTRPPTISSVSSSAQASSLHTPFNPPQLPIYIFLFLAYCFFYLNAYSPSPMPGYIESFRLMFGQLTFHYILIGITIVHVFEALLVVVVLTRRGERDVMTWILWVVNSLIFGHSWRLWTAKKEKAM
ncbi:13706_t:CDS:2 [Acaulospora morrowiae]|uniref:13706_t:CDS:1 n=1 Tax=Acaulospora morrowiae TaxID=94023 RepID=A0A9N9BYY8_9GLOM|nr:13706_t:CDS:2 [Acaulospora morrowiae]